MTWNWQQPDWPAFSWDPTHLRKAEEAFLLGAGIFVGALKHLTASDQAQLTIESISTEALSTSEIEGDILNRASVQSSVRRQFGLTTDRRKVAPAEKGISQMMVGLYRSFAEPLSCEMLFAWHRMLFAERGGLTDVGRYRTGWHQMEVVSGPLHAPKVHFEAPPSSSVPKQMSQFITWFNRTAPSAQHALPALTRAGIAHLYFESIHPFEDGNGRIGRAIADKVFAQALGQPMLTALSATMLERRKSYYAELEKANKNNDVARWLSWFAGIAIEAQIRTVARLEFLIEKTRLLDRLRSQINPRQEKALLRMLRDGFEGFQGGLSAGNYMTITGVSPATATRDLSDLIEKNALIRVGERRHARYHLTIPLRKVEPVFLDQNGDFSI